MLRYADAILRAADADAAFHATPRFSLIFIAPPRCRLLCRAAFSAAAMLDDFAALMPLR